MHIPLSFKVISLRADSVQHSVDLQEIREEVGPQPVGIGAPPSTVSVIVSPSQFADLRIGQSFVLVPDDRPALSGGQFVNRAAAGPFQSMGRAQ